MEFLQVDDEQSNDDGETVEDELNDERSDQIDMSSTKCPVGNKRTRPQKKRELENEMMQKTLNCMQQMTKSSTRIQQASVKDDDQIFADFVCSSLKGMTEEAKRCTKIAIQRAVLDGMSMYASKPAGLEMYGSM